MPNLYPVVVYADNKDYSVPAKISEQFEVSRCDNPEDFPALLAEKDAKLALVVCCDGGEECLKICEQVDEDTAVAEIPLILLADDINQEVRLRAFEFGCDDLLSTDTDADELLMRFNKSIFNRIANEQLQSRVMQANEMAFSAMSNTSDLGACLQFFLGSAECDNLDQLGQLFFSTIAHFELNCSLQIRSEYGRKDMEANGLAKDLESNLLWEMRNRGRYFDFGHRTIVNYGRVSILIKNMPVSDEARYGMIKDNIFTVIQGLDMKTRELDDRETLLKEKELLTLVSTRTKAMMHSIDDSFSDVIKDIAGVVDGMSLQYDNIIPTMLMTEEQEEKIYAVVDKGIKDTQEVFSRGLRVDEGYRNFLTAFEKIMGDEEMSTEKLDKLLDALRL